MDVHPAIETAKRAAACGHPIPNTASIDSKQLETKVPAGQQQTGLVQAEIDLEQARRVDESQRQAKLKQEELEADEDFQVQRQRAWDDWTDDNPRGAGNSRLRPTA